MPLTPGPQMGSSRFREVGRLGLTPRKGRPPPSSRLSPGRKPRGAKAPGTRRTGAVGSRPFRSPPVLLVFSISRYVLLSFQKGDQSVPVRGEPRPARLAVTQRWSLGIRSVGPRRRGPPSARPVVGERSCGSAVAPVTLRGILGSILSASHHHHPLGLVPAQEGHRSGPVADRSLLWPGLVPCPFRLVKEVLMCSSPFRVSSGG